MDWDEEDEVTGYQVAGGADGALLTVEADTGELSFKEAPDYENPTDLESEDPRSGAADNEYILVVEVTSGEGERERTSGAGDPREGEGRGDGRGRETVRRGRIRRTSPRGTWRVNG